MTAFADRGFHRTTIRDVARAVGVADGTIYTYFANKTALFIGLLDPLDDAAALPPPIDDPRAFFGAVLTQRWASFDGESLKTLRVVLSELLVDPSTRRSRRAVSSTWTGRIQQITTSLLDAAGDRFGLVRDVARPLPMTVIAEMLGVPERNRGDFARWSNRLPSSTTSPRGLLISLPAVLALISFVRRLIRSRRANPKMT